VAGCAWRLRKYAITSHTMPPVSATRRMKPSTLANASKPKILASTPATSPPIRIERQPPNHDDPPTGACAVGALPGCVMDLSIGATLGAVFVAGGLEYVRDPRLPKLPPPPTRASAAVAKKLRAPSIARTIGCLRKQRGAGDGGARELRE